jgi:hypothetical protein
MSHRTEQHQPRRSAVRQSTAPDAAPAAHGDVCAIEVAIVERQPDPSYADGRLALADTLVLQMFDSDVGETMQLVYTMLRQHQERTNQRLQQTRATDTLRAHLAQLDDHQDEA